MNTAASPIQQQKVFLNIGCGSVGTQRMPATLQQPEWQHVRIDMDESVNPDIVASFADLHMIETSSVDAIWSSHSLEHMPWHEVELALAEATRVLRPEGFVFLTLPDLTQLAQLVLDGKLMEVAYQAPAGPITALDMLYGHIDAQARGKPFMAHSCGFTSESLGQAFIQAGFSDIKIVKGSCYDLWALASTTQLPAQLVQELNGKRG